MEAHGVDDLPLLRRGELGECPRIRTHHLTQLVHDLEVRHRYLLRHVLGDIGVALGKCLGQLEEIHGTHVCILVLEPVADRDVGRHVQVDAVHDGGGRTRQPRLFLRVRVPPEALTLEVPPRKQVGQDARDRSRRLGHPLNARPDDIPDVNLLVVGLRLCLGLTDLVGDAVADPLEYLSLRGEIGRVVVPNLNAHGILMLGVVQDLHRVLEVLPVPLILATVVQPLLELGLGLPEQQPFHRTDVVIGSDAAVLVRHVGYLAVNG